jgi:hypothetical protein
MNPSLTVYATDGLDSINDPSPVLSPDLYEYGLDIDVNS